MAEKIVVIGAGQAGAWIARSAREAGFDGSITMIGNEVHLPYERPPLSKDGLTCGEGAGYKPVFDAQEYAEMRIAVVTGEHVATIDREQRRVILESGRVYEYDKLAIATGGRARRPAFPGSDLPHVLKLRTLEDSAAIAARLRDAQHAVIVGGGWIGLEVAASARAHGVQTTVLEFADRVCARSVPPRISDYLKHVHQQEGVNILLNTSVDRIDCLDDGRLSVVLAGSNTVLEPADVVVLGAGLIPNVELAAHAGLEIDNGIVVDQRGATSDPLIFAAGDVAATPLSWAGRRIRLESWANAQNQAIAVGRNMAGIATGYDDLPWVWSDQYDLNIQISGIFDAGKVEMIRGYPESNNFTLFQTEGHRITAAVAVGNVKEAKLIKKLIKDRAEIDIEKFADMSNPIKQCML